jgi:hypothetical protein
MSMSSALPSTSPFFELMLKDLDFFSQLVSIHFPFTESEINEYWDVLVPGVGHFPVYLSDTDWCYSSSIGLCSNQNIRWTESLREKWSIGFNDPFNGYLIGLGIHPVEYDDMEKFRQTFLPMNLSELEHWAFRAAGDNYSSSGQIEEFLEKELDNPHEDVLHKHYNRLNFEDFFKLYQYNKSAVLLNRSIWYNTLYQEIQGDDIFKLLKNTKGELQK